MGSYAPDISHKSQYIPSMHICSIRWSKIWSYDNDRMFYLRKSRIFLSLKFCVNTSEDVSYIVYSLSHIFIFYTFICLYDFTCCAEKRKPRAFAFFDQIVCFIDYSRVLKEHNMRVKNTCFFFTNFLLEFVF